MIQLNYTVNGDYQIPNLTIPSQTSHPLNKYGRMRMKFLMEYHPVLYQTMLLNGTLTNHLEEINETASRRLEALLPAMAKTANVTEEQKIYAPLLWTQQMNNLKAQAEEIILAELIYI